MPKLLSDTQVEMMARDGYVAPIPIFDAEQAAAYRVRLEAFEASGAQAINYNANVWHAPRNAIGAPGELLMFRWDDGSEDDTELRTLEKPFTVELRR